MISECIIIMHAHVYAGNTLRHTMSINICNSRSSILSSSNRIVMIMIIISSILALCQEDAMNAS